MCDCERALELISLGLDEMLTGDERRELGEHLEACQACRSLARELNEVHAALSELVEEVPEGFHAAVMDRVRAEKIVAFPARKRKKRQRWLSVAAVFAVILIGAGSLKGYLGGGTAGNTAPMAAAQANNGTDVQTDEAATPEAAGVMPFAVDGGASAEIAPYAKERMTPTPRIVNNEAVMSAEPEAAAEDTRRTPTDEERETIAANCAAWVLKNGYDQVDTGLVDILPVAQAELEAVVCDTEAQERLGPDDWRVTVGDTAQDHIGLVCDGETLEVLGYLLSF